MIEQILVERRAVLPPVVLAELLSSPRTVPAISAVFRALPLLSILNGYWERTGMLRAKVLARGHKARLADSLIAQSCIDHHVPLITRDGDFRHFAGRGGLRLLP
ncbi:MAG TPA: PIN domain-containing protein [Polyangia bacterium]|nr:PIN domain-containing protein [Polyangia bacterium]